MNVKNNKRIQETDVQIIRAVYDLFVHKKKPLSKITVREVCEIAGIHRSTFYAHYMDIYDVVEKVEQRMSGEPLRVFFEKLDQGGSSRECFVELIRFFYDYREFYRVYLNEAQVFSTVERLFEGVRDRIDPNNIPKNRKGREYEYYGYFAVYGVMAVIRYWLNSECKETPEDLYEIIRSEKNALEWMFNW